MHCLKEWKNPFTYKSHHSHLFIFLNLHHILNYFHFPSIHNFILFFWINSCFPDTYSFYFSKKTTFYTILKHFHIGNHNHIENKLFYEISPFRKNLERPHIMNSEFEMKEYFSKYNQPDEGSESDYQHPFLIITSCCLCFELSSHTHF